MLAVSPREPIRLLCRLARSRWSWGTNRVGRSQASDLVLLWHSSGSTPSESLKALFDLHYFSHSTIPGSGRSSSVEHLSMPGGHRWHGLCQHHLRGSLFFFFLNSVSYEQSLELFATSASIFRFYFGLSVSVEVINKIQFNSPFRVSFWHQTYYASSLQVTPETSFYHSHPRLSATRFIFFLLNIFQLIESCEKRDRQDVL